MTNLNPAPIRSELTWLRHCSRALQAPTERCPAAAYLSGRIFPHHQNSEISNISPFSSDIYALSSQKQLASLAPPPMAHDSFRSQPAPEQPGFYDYSDTHYSHPAEPHQHSHLHHHPPEYERTRPRGTSNSRLDEFSTASTQYQSSQQPINDAVTSAFSKAETTNHLPPEILNQITSQITASVIQQLKASNLDTKAANTNYPPATSPSTHSGSSPPPAPGNRHVYTPPSPHRPSDDLPLDSPTSQAKFPNQSFGRASPPLDRRAASPLSQVSQAGWSTYREKEKDRDVDSRPKGPIRLDTETEETTLERIWGQLFDVENHPTLRLGQFLRGIAIHLVGSPWLSHALKRS